MTMESLPARDERSGRQELDRDEPGWRGQGRHSKHLSSPLANNTELMKREDLADADYHKKDCTCPRLEP